ncbi:hypothetical protein N7466_001487 [Penicillium verhagenii]|uniref:uncharacterized protein n=1 Tax=Penicillium verhagenii TaxID=1562060 RepID=UPI002544DA68|nr:uncharacterized protein N7466_001487 [Penicillium verhagenii]KAJ5938353.1 hypothetical protein N7466_001487 [Penicillium verhagenii]
MPGMMLGQHRPRFGVDLPVSNFRSNNPRSSHRFENATDRYPLGCNFSGSPSDGHGMSPSRNVWFPLISDPRPRSNCHGSTPTSHLPQAISHEPSPTNRLPRTDSSYGTGLSQISHGGMLLKPLVGILLNMPSHLGNWQRVHGNEIYPRWQSN